MNKKLRKIQMIFDIEIDFESQILALFDTSPLHQFSNSITSFDYHESMNSMYQNFDFVKILTKDRSSHNHDSWNTQ